MSGLVPKTEKEARVSGPKEPLSAKPPELTPKPEVHDLSQTIAAIEKLGGQVTFEGSGSDRRVIVVDLRNTKVSDQDLRHLAGMIHLQRLYLQYTTVGDEGMVHLANLRSLQNLDLCHTRVGDKGAEIISKLPALKWVDLRETNATALALGYFKRLGPADVLLTAVTRSREDFSPWAVAITA